MNGRRSTSEADSGLNVCRKMDGSSKQSKPTNLAMAAHFKQSDVNVSSQKSTISYKSTNLATHFKQSDVNVTSQKSTVSHKSTNFVAHFKQTDVNVASQKSTVGHKPTDLTTNFKQSDENVSGQKSTVSHKPRNLTTYFKQSNVNFSSQKPTICQKPTNLAAHFKQTDVNVSSQKSTVSHKPTDFTTDFTQSDENVSGQKSTVSHKPRNLTTYFKQSNVNFSSQKPTVCQKPTNLTSYFKQSDVNVPSQKSTVSHKPTNLTTHFKPSDMIVSTQKSTVSQKPTNLTSYFKQSDVNVSCQKSTISQKPRNLSKYFKQSDVNVSSQKPTVSSIFEGISVYVNGKTDPPPEKLKRLVLTHGGRYIYYPCKSNITHIIASNPSYTKIKELKNGKAVLPNWITDSVEAGRLLPDSLYLYQASKLPKRPVSGAPPKELPQRSNMKTMQKLQKQKEHGKVLADQLCEVNKEDNLKITACPQQTSKVPSVGVRSVSMKLPEGKSQVNHLYSEGEHPVGPFGQQQFNGCSFPRSTDPNFLSIFYSHSRLHHLTTWKAKHKAFVKKLQQNGDRSFPGRKQLSKMISSRKMQNRTELKSGKKVADRTDSKDKRWPSEKKGQSSKKNDPVIMHIDMDCFFVSVSIVKYPELQGKPVAVAHYAWKSDSDGKRSDSKSKEEKMWAKELGARQHNTGTFGDGMPKRTSTKHIPKSGFSNSEGDVQDEEERFSERSKERQSLLSSIASERENFSSLAEIASCSYEARKAGVKNGMIMKKAKQLCPDLRTIPYDFEGYYKVSRQLYEIVARYTHDIEACSCDELLVDITTVLEDTGATPLEFAEVVREEIYEKTRCTASAGIASSAVLARLCTRVAKPNGVHQLAEGEEAELLNSVPVRELPGVGGSISKKLQSLGIFTCADLQQLTLNALQKEFGPKTGHILYQHCRGQDDKPLTMERERKYVSVEVNYGIRFQTEDDVVEFVYRLGGELHKRLKDLGMVGRTITVKLKVRRAGTPKEDTKFMGYGVYDNKIRSSTLRQETDDLGTIQRECRTILRQLNALPEDIRGVGVQISRLKNVSSLVGVTKSLEDMLPKKKDVSKRSISLDSVPSTSKTSGNAKSYSLLNFVQPKRKLSLDEDLMKCKSKKTDTVISSPLPSESKSSSSGSSAGSVARKQENAKEEKDTIVKTTKARQSSSTFTDEKMPFFAKERSKMELSSKEQSSSQLSQKFGNSVNTMKMVQSSSATVTEKAAQFAKEKGKPQLSSKVQSSSQSLQEFGNSVKTMKAGQFSSAAVIRKASPSSQERDKTKLSERKESPKQLSQDDGKSLAVVTQTTPAVPKTSQCAKESDKDDWLEQSSQESEKSDVLYSKSGKPFTQLEDPEFLTEFYRHSKYHLMSAWRVEHKSFIKKLRSTEDRKFPGLEKFKIFLNAKDSGSSDKVETSNGNTASQNSTCASEPSQNASSNDVRSESVLSEDKSVIMHVDMDCFFVAVSLMKFPELQGRPIAVAHAGAKPMQNMWFEDFDKNFLEKKKWKSRTSECVEISHKERVNSPEIKKDPGSEEGQSGAKQGQNAGRKMSEWEVTYYNSMAEISSCSYEAREAGVEKGMLLADAVTLCPNLLTLPYDFEKYHEVSRILYETVASFTDEIEAVSCDEMFIDITKILRETGTSPVEIAHFIRDEILAKSRCTASAGIASNTLLARLCTRVAKPNGIFQLEDDKVEDFMKKWPVRDLPGVGESIGKKLLAKFGIESCADLQQLPLTALQKEFGPKTGQILYQSCRGQAEKPIRMEKERKYVSVDVNFGIRFKNEEEVVDFIYRLAEELHKRLKDLKVAGRKVTMKLKVRRPGILKNSLDDSRFLGTGEYDSKYRSVTLPQETDDLATIKREFKSIYFSLKVKPENVRGVGVQLSRLKKVSSLLGVTKSLEELLPKKSDVLKTSPPTSPDKNPFTFTSKTLAKPRRYSLLNFVQPKRKSTSDEDSVNCKSKKVNESMSSTDESELESSSESLSASSNFEEEDGLKDDTANASHTPKVTQLSSVVSDRRKAQDLKETGGYESKERSALKKATQDVEKSKSAEVSPSKNAKDMGKSESAEVSPSKITKDMGKSESAEVSPSKIPKDMGKSESAEVSPSKITKDMGKSESVEGGQSKIVKNMGKSKSVEGRPSKIVKNMDKSESMERSPSHIAKDLVKSESKEVSSLKVPTGVGENASEEEMSMKCALVKSKSNISTSKSGKRYTQVSDPEFLSQFYQNSKFHHISTWKVEHTTFINELQKKEEKKFPGKKKLQMLTNTADTTGKEESPTEHSISKTYFGSGRTLFDHVGPERIVWENRSVIMHIDMDCFFVSVSLLNFPELRGIPLAVAHTGVKSKQVMDIWFEDFERAYLEKRMWNNSATKCIEISRKERVHPYGTAQIEEDGEKLGATAAENGVNKPPSLEATYFNSMAEIASCSYEAREAGVENGMLLVEGKALCPDLRTVPYDFENYHKVSRLMYETVASFTNEIEAVSCDEMFVDITKILRDTGATPTEFAQLVRDEIFAKTQCTASVGIASNTLLARLCTRVAKPNGIFLLEDDKVDNFMKTVPVRDLPGIGEAISQKLLMLGVTMCGDMQQLSLTALQRQFGSRTGHDLYQHCRGKNDQPIKTEREQKLVSSTVNYGIRFKTNEDALKFIFELAEVVHKKLQKTGMRGRTIMLKLKLRRKGTPQEELKFMGHGICENKTRTISLRQETDDLAIIKKESRALYWQMGAAPRDIRGVGLHITRLKKSNSASSKSLIDMLPKKSDLSKSPTSTRSPTFRLKADKSPSSSSPISTFFNRKRGEPRYFFPDDEEVFKEEQNGCKVPEKKNASSSPIHSSPDKPIFSPKPKSMFGSSPIKRERADSDSPSNSPLNSPSNLDPEVLSSLPPDILREVLEEERLKMKKTQNIVEKLGHVEDLPSFSKIDPSCLDALPKEIQGELFTAYRRKAALASLKTPEKKFSFQTQLSPVKAAKRKRSISKERPKKVEYEKPSWQRNIFEALHFSQSQSQSAVKVNEARQKDMEDNVEKVMKKEI